MGKKDFSMHHVQSFWLPLYIPFNIHTGLNTKIPVPFIKVWWSDDPIIFAKQPNDCNTYFEYLYAMPVAQEQLIYTYDPADLTFLYWGNSGPTWYKKLEHEIQKLKVLQWKVRIVWVGSARRLFRAKGLPHTSNKPTRLNLAKWYGMMWLSNLKGG